MSVDVTLRPSVWRAPNTLVAKLEVISTLSISKGTTQTRCEIGNHFLFVL